MKNTLSIFLLAFIMGGSWSRAQEPPARKIVRPVEINDVLNNPGIGFITFQRFNGDTLNYGERWTEGLPIVYQDFDGDLTNVDYPQTTIAYFRVNWKFVEPEKEKYNWAMIDKALRTAAERGQTLMLRISPYEANDKDVPGWYRTLVGEEDKSVSAKWRVDHEDPRYLRYFGGMIKALGQRYDGHPDLESVDVSIVGFYGEGEGTHLLSDKIRQALINCYLDSFKRTHLTFQPLNGDAPDPGVLVSGTNIAASWPDGRTNGTGPRMRYLGYRLDCLGDMSTYVPPARQWSHMGDAYPIDIVRSGMSEAWKKAPITMEICHTFRQWLHTRKYGEDQVNHIFEEALKWHISSFNAKSSAVPEEWRPLIDRWLNRMGYRFVLRRFEYPSTVTQQGRLYFTSLWENIGVAPIYKEYKLAFRLKSNRKSPVLLTDADIRSWLPGDIVCDETLFIPYDTPPGTYQLEVAIIAPATLEPKVRLAIEGRTEEGWYPLGEIKVTAPSF